jgi:phosphopantothenoylcysteine decarboxylase/phosphopantothenate--cysteine ligase
MTEAARHFITPVTMQALSGRPVFTDQWDSRISNNMAHIDLTREADAVMIAPCSADFMRKLVHGAADDLLSTLCLARPASVPLLVAPAMNVEMWENAATQRNATQLHADGVSLLGPVAGEQACGETGLGRMMEPEALMEELEAFFHPKLLQGKKLLITAGPTFEPIDPVRGITNLSSGKMGYAIARAARRAGADVTLVSGPTSLPAPAGVRVLPVTTARQMHDAVMANVSARQVFIAVAAVADWRVAEVSPQKIKKQDGATPSLAFEPNPDILAAVAALPSPPYCVGFAAESENLLEHGTAKRRKKNIPLLVGNIGHQTFGQDDNELVLFDDAGHHPLPRASKEVLAEMLIGEIAKRIST